MFCNSPLHYSGHSDCNILSSEIPTVSVSASRYNKASNAGIVTSAVFRSPRSYWKKVTVFRSAFQFAVLSASLICSATSLQAEPERAPQATSDQEQLRNQISQLIPLLESNQRQERRRAELQLISLGKPVLELLPPPELVPGNSAREALKRIRLQIEQRAAEASLKSSMITLKGEHSLQSILDEIVTQSGNPIDINQIPKAVLKNKIRIDFEKTPFWRAIDELSATLSLRYQLNGSNGDLQLLPVASQQAENNQRKPQVDYDGPFRIEIANIERRALLGNSDRELLRVTFQILVEPRLRPLFLSYAASEIKAGTKQNLNFAPFNPEAKYELPLGEGGKNLNFTMQWLVDGKQLPKGIQIHGDLKMELAAETLPITFDHLSRSQGAVRRRGNVSVELVDAESIKRKDAENLNVRIAISYDYGGPAFESHRTWIYHNRAYLQNPQGQRYWLNGSSQTTLESAGKIGVLYEFKDLPSQQTDYQFTYLAPTLITSAPIQLQFDSVTIPEEVTRVK